MNREEYLAALSRKLRRLPRREYEAAMEYYREYFDEAGPEMEQQVIRDLGTPEEAASQIIRNTAYQRMNEPVRSMKKGFSVLWVVVLGIFAVPIAVPLAIALLCVLLAMAFCGFAVWLCGIFAAVISVAAGLAAAVCGGLAAAAHPATGIANIGAGILIIGFGLLGLLFAMWLGRGLLFIARKLFSKVLGGRRA